LKSNNKVATILMHAKRQHSCHSTYKKTEHTFKLLTID